MARKLFGAIAAVALASDAMFALVGPASAGTQNFNSLTINKDVVGTAPANTVFSVQVSCTPQFGTQTVWFDETGDPSDSAGNPIATPVIHPGIDDTCTVTETFDGDATSFHYTCVLGAVHVRTTCVTNNQVEYNDVTGDSATVTVTNTYDPTTTTTTATTTPPTTTTTTVAPKVAPKAVVAAANFTG